MVSQTVGRELTDGERMFVLTGGKNQHGYLRADVVRVTEDGRVKGWQVGCQVWLRPEWVERMEAVDA